MKANELAKTLARILRQNQTIPEKLLWDKLRNRNFAGLKFTRQHPIYYFKAGQKKFFIADFYCHDLKLILELDGKINSKQQNYDKARKEILKTKSLNILRFRNEEIESNIGKCLKILINYANL